MSNDEIAEFADWILKVSDGNIGIGEDGLSEIEIPEENLILTDDDPVEAITTKKLVAREGIGEGFEIPR